MLAPSKVKTVGDGDPTLLVWKVPDEFSGEKDKQTFVVPVLSRNGGFLFAVPALLLDDNVLLDAALEEQGLLGPSNQFTSEMIEEDDDGQPMQVGATTTITVVDVSADVLKDCREYDPVTDGTERILPFDDDHPNALPSVSDVLEDVKLWIENTASGRMNFFSAREEPEQPKPPPRKAAAKKVTTAVLSEQLGLLMSQVKVIAEQQEEMKRQQALSSATPAEGGEPGQRRAGMPSVSATLVSPPVSAVKKAVGLIGPPPKTKQSAYPPIAPVDPVSQVGLGQTEADENQPGWVNVLAQQGAALTALVAHLASGDALTDLQAGSSSSGLSVSTKGVARRERLQADLASRSSQYFLQVQQQLHKRLFPAQLIPKTEEEVQASGVNLTTYLERHGNFKGQREQALLFWILAHSFDAAASGDFHATKEYLALAVASLDQACLDGHWQVAYLLSLLEEPPHQMFAEKAQSSSSATKPFGSLVPPSWAAIALAYLKEVEMLSSKKSESKRSAAPTAKADPDNAAPSPRRRPRFPKKAKAGAGDSTQN